MSRILITGANGFSGKAMKIFLERNSNLDIFCSGRSQDFSSKYFQCDLSVRKQVSYLIREVKPDQIYHLAGSATNNFEIDFASNVYSTFNVMDEIAKDLPDCKLLIIGSAAEYGMPSVNPVKENSNLNPLSVYGLSKKSQTDLMHFFFTNWKINVKLARTFNLLGRGLSSSLFIGKLYEQINLFKLGKIEFIELGNLEHKRDYILIEDAVKLYYQIMNFGKSGEVYNVGSGKSIKIKDLLMQILKSEQVNESAIRSSISVPNENDVSEIYADLTKINSILN